MSGTRSTRRAGVLLDVDGTLLDTNCLHALAWWQAMRDAGVEGVTMADTHQAIGIASGELVRRLAGGENERAIEAHSQRYEALRSDVTAFAGAADLITRCHEVGLAVVLATSGQQEDLDWMVPAIGVADEMLTGAVTSGDVESAKPSPDLLSVGMEKFGLDPDRTVSIGDTVWDVQASHDAGVWFVAFTSGGIPRCQLQNAGAEEIYRGPSDLVEHWSQSRLARLADSLS